MWGKIPIIIMGIVITNVAMGTSMCVHTKSYVAQLSATDNGTAHTTGANGAWTVTVPYITSSMNTPYITGYAGCAEVGADTAVNTADTTVSITGGEVSGPYCWCVMKTPLVSYPTLAYKDYADSSACSADCADKCGTVVQTVTAFRTAMFGAIW